MSSRSRSFLGKKKKKEDNKFGTLKLAKAGETRGWKKRSMSSMQTKQAIEKKYQDLKKNTEQRSKKETVAHTFTFNTTKLNTLGLAHRHKRELKLELHRRVLSVFKNGKKERSYQSKYILALEKSVVDPLRMRMLITTRSSPAVFVFESGQHRELCFQVLKTMQKLDAWNGTVARKKPSYTLSTIQPTLEETESQDQDMAEDSDEDVIEEEEEPEEDEEEMQAEVEVEAEEEQHSSQTTSQVTVVVTDEQQEQQEEVQEEGKGRSGSFFKRGRSKSKQKKTKSTDIDVASDTISALENVLRDTLQFSVQAVELDVNNDLEISPRAKQKAEEAKNANSNTTTSSDHLTVQTEQQEDDEPEQRETKTRTHEVFNVFVGTWNMGEAAPPDDLNDWIPSDRFDDSAESYDIAVIGVQEGDYTARSGYSTCESDWFSTIQNHLGDRYATVASFSMWAIRLIVLLRQDKMNKVTNVQKASVGTGLANVAGNKGAVGISFNLNETSLCFVCAHLAAHQTKIADREEDYIQIIKNLKLGAHDDQELVPAKFHHLFFFGDLNYRIDMPRASVLSLIKNKEYDILLQSDQLLTVRDNGELYGGFDEGAIEFAPTYKMLRDEFDAYTDKKERIPSYCDRIMWLTMPGFLDHMQQMEYNWAPGIMTSDHKPVYASFEMATVLGETLDVEVDGTLQHPVQFLCRKLPGYRYNKFVIHFWDVEAVELELPLSTSKETYLEVEMRAPFLSTPVASQQSAAATELAFNEDTFPMLFPYVHNAAFLSKQHVTVILHQRSKGGSDKVVGTGVISLQNTNQESQIFECTLYKAGKITGELFGQVAIRERTSFKQIESEGINSPGLTKKNLEGQDSDEWEESDEDEEEEQW